MEKYLYSDRKILENEAELCNDKIKDHTDCQECGEDYLFMMKDNYHEFSIGLSTILSCLAMAEKEGAVPKIPFIVDITTPYCILIAKWSGDFCRTLAWSIFDDSETSED